MTITTKAPYKTDKGHLREGPIHLVVTEDSKKSIIKQRKAKEAFDKLKPITLDWKRKAK